LGDDAGVGEGEVFGDDAAPAVRAEFDGGHEPRLYAKARVRQQPHWTANSGFFVRLAFAHSSPLGNAAASK
jgi:hypothetical protein